MIEILTGFDKNTIFFIHFRNIHNIDRIFLRLLQIHLRCRYVEVAISQVFNIDDFI